MLKFESQENMNKNCKVLYLNILLILKIMIYSNKTFIFENNGGLLIIIIIIKKPQILWS